MSFSRQPIPLYRLLPRAPTIRAGSLAPLRAPYTGMSAASSFISKPPPSLAPHELLPRQRLNRPVAPHLGMYKWQITSVMSVLTRLSGIALGGTFYGFAALYAASPWLGLDLSSASLAVAFGETSGTMHIMIKTAMAWPFCFHCLSGVRYLSWDLTLGVQNRTVIKTGWAVVIGSFFGAFICGAAL